MKIILKNLMALTMAGLAVIAVLYSNRNTPVKDATWEDVAAESRAGDYRLIKTDELWEKYRENPDSIRLVDTRQEWEFRTGHIKQAKNFPMEPTWLSRWQKKKSLGRFLGPDKSALIVFY